MADIFIYILKIPEFGNGYKKVLCWFQRNPTNQIVPHPNVQPGGLNLPLEPRRDCVSLDPAMNSSAPAEQSGAMDTLRVPQRRREMGSCSLKSNSAQENWLMRYDKKSCGWNGHDLWVEQSCNSAWNVNSFISCHRSVKYFHRKKAQIYKCDFVVVFFSILYQINLIGQISWIHLNQSTMTVG